VTSQFDFNQTSWFLIVRFDTACTKCFYALILLNFISVAKCCLVNYNLINASIKRVDCTTPNLNGVNTFSKRIIPMLKLQKYTVLSNPANKALCKIQCYQGINQELFPQVQSWFEITPFGTWVFTDKTTDEDSINLNVVIFHFLSVYFVSLKYLWPYIYVICMLLRLF